MSQSQATQLRGTHAGKRTGSAGNGSAIANNGIFDVNGPFIQNIEPSAVYYAVFPFGMKNPEPQFRFIRRRSSRVCNVCAAT